MDWNGQEIKERSFKLLDESFIGKRPDLGTENIDKTKKKKKKVEEFDHEDLGFENESD